MASVLLDVQSEPPSILKAPNHTKLYTPKNVRWMYLPRTKFLVPDDGAPPSGHPGTVLSKAAMRVVSFVMTNMKLCPGQNAFYQ